MKKSLHHLVLQVDSFDLPFVFLILQTTNSSAADTVTAIVQPITTPTISPVFAVLLAGNSDNEQSISPTHAWNLKSRENAVRNNLRI